MKLEPGGTIAHRILYPAVRGLAKVLFKTIWRLKVTGDENVPATGAFIVAPNHRSYADPPLVGVAVFREVHFLAKKELFSFRPFGWFIKNLNAHPLNRAGDIAAFREAGRILKRGGALIVFPEGRRMGRDVFGSPKAGVGMLASSSGAPVLPVYIHQSGYMTQFRRVFVRFGQPVNPADYGSYQEISEEVMRRIRKMAEDF
jgi:1-acyl-sn-glycerol-3-phosphate acyltransferase